MKEKQFNAIEESAPRPCRFLLLDTAGDAGPFADGRGERVSSPQSCLCRAIDTQPTIIVVRMANGPLLMREAMVRLCTALKRNCYTRAIPIVVLMHGKHRKLLEKLCKAGVEFIKYDEAGPLDPEKTRWIIDSLRPEDLTRVQLDALCPFLTYHPIDARHEIMVCGAYLDRMVLGGRRLNEICHTTDHHHCIYFSMPRDVA